MEEVDQDHVGRRWVLSWQGFPVHSRQAERDLFDWEIVMLVEGVEGVEEVEVS